MSRPLLLAFLPLALACTDKGGGDDSGPGPTDGGGSDDTGDTGGPVTPVWTDLSFQSSGSVTGVYAAGTDEAWVTQSGGVVQLYQAGAWNDLSPEVDDEDVNGVWGSGSGSAATVVAVADSGFVGTWTAAGWDIQDVGTANFEAVDGAASSDLLAVGWGGLYSNASGDWAFVDLKEDPRINHVWYDGNAGAIVGEDGLLGRLVNGEWTFEEDKEVRSFYGVSGTGVSDIYAVGEGGVILHWNGTIWEDVTPAESINSQSLWAVWAATSDAVFAVGNNGAALVRSGGIWRPLPTGVNKNLYAVHGTGVSDVWAVGGFGTVLRYQP